MNVRQVIGKRRSAKTMQARGIKRRALLVDATIELLQDHSPQEISLKQIAKHAGIPEGSTYHFYANKYDLFTDVVRQLIQQFEIAFRQPINRPVKGWQDITDSFIDRAVEIYNQSSPTRELLIGSKIPPEIKQADSELAGLLAGTMVECLSSEFEVPRTNNLDRIMGIAIELVDTILSRSVREHGIINEFYTEEAKRVLHCYLGIYLPQVLPRSE